MFTLPSLPYSYEALEPFIDKETMTIHHTKHHQAYVDKLNTALEKYPDLQKKTIEELLKDLSSIPENIRTAVKNNGGGHYNHSLFWRIMAPASESKTSGIAATLNSSSAKFMETLNSTYGGFDSFKTAFKNAALNRFGSGWVWIVKNADKIEITDTPNQDSPLSEGKLPILGLDVWEHAYYLKYKSARAEYVDAWWNVVNWPEVEKIYANVA